jgi:hypothetical protein
MLKERVMLSRAGLLILVLGTTPIIAGQPSAERFVAQGQDVVLDTVSGKEWTRSDNGKGSNWHVAVSWCAARGEGWRLPHLHEFGEIYDRSKTQKTKCDFAQCNVSPLFRLSAVEFWTATTHEGPPAEATVINLVLGASVPAKQDAAGVRTRALCVKGDEISKSGE